MSDKETELKTYKVLKRLGWQGGLYVEGDTVEMTEEWAKYYVENEVLESTSTIGSSVFEAAPTSEIFQGGSEEELSATEPPQESEIKQAPKEEG